MIFCEGQMWTENNWSNMIRDAVRIFDYGPDITRQKNSNGKTVIT